MGNNCSISFDENKQWLKCLVAVNVLTRDALLEVLHDPKRGGIPSDPQKLYDFFQEKKQQDKIKELQKKKVLNPDQVALLLPQNQRTFSEKWDITLICVVIINFSNLPPPTNGWFKPLDAGDISVSAFVVIARSELRNKLNHGTAEDFNDEKTFRPLWQMIYNVLNAFQYTKINDFQDLETDEVDVNIFTPEIDRFMDGVDCKKVKKQFLNGWKVTTKKVSFQMKCLIVNWTILYLKVSVTKEMVL